MAQLDAEGILLKYRPVAPENVNDAKIIQTYRNLEGDDDKVQAEISTWWQKAGERAPSVSGTGSSIPESDRAMSEKPKKSKKEKREKKKKTPQRKNSFRGNTSQVRLLAEHCFTLSDEAVQSLVRYRIPSQSRWDFKQKIHVRDETIKHLQRALDLLNQEKQRFKTACIDIENGLQEELGEVKSELAVAHHSGATGIPVGLGYGVGGGGGSSNNDEELRQVREDLAEARATKKSMDKELTEAVDARKTLEKKVSELNEQLMRLHFEKREGEADKGRAAEEVYRLSQELANSRKALEMKNKELSLALASFSEHQRNAEKRESEMRSMKSGNDEHTKELEVEKKMLLEQLSDLKAKAAIGGNELESTKSLLAETKRELDSIKSDFDLMKDTQGSVTQKYENEKALKERAQQMEENERRERIAACAQLIAIQQHHGMVMQTTNAHAEKDLAAARTRIEELEALDAAQKSEIKVSTINLSVINYLQLNCLFFTVMRNTIRSFIPVLQP